MQYDSLSRNTVKITLSEEELREYSLCSENISMRTVETKRNLAKLLKRMKLFSGYKAERLFLEAFPRAGGGCVLYVSSLNGGEELLPQPPQSSEPPEPTVQRCEIMCAVDSFARLIQLCAGLDRLCGGADTRAYSSDGAYFLILSGKKREAEAAKRLMLEYGEIRTDFAGIRAAAEEGRLICGENAANKLALLF